MRRSRICIVGGTEPKEATSKSHSPYNDSWGKGEEEEEKGLKLEGRRLKGANFPYAEQLPIVWWIWMG